MKSLPSPRDQRELESLLSAYCDGKLDSRGGARLAKRLESDPAARRFYLHYLDLHLELDRRADVARLLPTSPPHRSTPFLWKALAAAAAIAAMASALVLWPRGSDRPTGVASNSVAPAAEIAFVSYAEDVEWNHRELAELGMHLSRGDEIELSSGTLRIDFFDGSAATIVGPAQFELFSSTELVLALGKLAVRSDGPTPGFSVRTPGALFVDVGTEFALTVGDSAVSQMRVIEGEVIATLVSGDGVALEERAAFAGEYLSVDPDVGIAEADANPSGFVAMVDPSVLPLAISEEYVAAVKRAKPEAYWRFEKARKNQVVDETGNGFVAHSMGAVRLEGLEGRQNRTIFLQGDESKRGLFVEVPLSEIGSGEYSIELWMNAQNQQHAGLLSLVELKSRTLKDALRETPAFRMTAIECTAGEPNRWSQAPLGKVGFFNRLRGGIGERPGWPGGRDHQKARSEKRDDKKDGSRERGERSDRSDKHHAHDDSHHNLDGGHSGWQGHDRSRWGDKKRSWWDHRDRGGRSGLPGGDRGGYFASGSRDFESRVYSKDQYKPGTWHHIVAVRESDRILLYLDGELQAETAASPSAELADMNLIIGRYSLAPGWLGRPFAGRIDELAIYARALSAEEINEHAGLVD